MSMGSTTIRNADGNVKVIHCIDKSKVFSNDFREILQDMILSRVVSEGYKHRDAPDFGPPIADLTQQVGATVLDAFEMLMNECITALAQDYDYFNGRIKTLGLAPGEEKGKQEED